METECKSFSFVGSINIEFLFLLNLGKGKKRAQVTQKRVPRVG